MDNFQEFVSALPFIAEDASWGNGTGYLDRAVKGPHAPALAPKEMARSTSLERTVLFMGTEEGNVVLFRRYSGNEGPWVCNSPEEFAHKCKHDISSAITEDVVKDILGYTK